MTLIPCKEKGSFPYPSFPLLLPPYLDNFFHLLLVSNTSSPQVMARATVLGEIKYAQSSKSSWASLQNLFYGNHSTHMTFMDWDLTKESIFVSCAHPAPPLNT